MIEVRNLRKSFGNIVAVNDLSFQINKGESFGLLGPNGAGKTTAISMLIGLLSPDEGEVEVLKDPGIAASVGGCPSNPSVRSRIGVAPQSLSLYGELTARENLEFFGKLYGLAGGYLKGRVDWALEFASLPDRQKDRVETFSGGMKRRMNIAVALIHDPELLLLEEPTVGVDPQSRNHIFDSIENLKKNGMTILYTTHYMEEAQRLCDRVAIMDGGKLLALDSVPGLIAKYGGTSVVTAELSKGFEETSWLESLSGGSMDGNAMRFESERPLEQVAELTGKGVQFQTLQIAQPDLESVFLSLTGRSLRD